MSLMNCMVAQSGGPTAAINASLAGVIRGVMDSNKYDICYGSLNGITGIIDDRVINLSEIASNAGFIEQLTVSPAMYLGSCRYKLPTADVDASIYKKIFDYFMQKQIKAFFYIGGNDSMDTVLKLSRYAKEINYDISIIGIPKTIDNDLCETDHTPGFGSAAKYIATTMLEIAHDTFIYHLKSVTIVEIMGRDAGWLTAASALARNNYNNTPDFIYLPEVAFHKDAFVKDVKKALESKNNVIIAVSEGIHDENGEYITAGEASADTFGHKQLSGAGKALETIVKNEIGVKVRSVEINVLQRCAAHLLSETDIKESFAQGQKAVSLAENNISASMVCIKRESNHPYDITYSYAAIDKIANEAKSIPREWINPEGNDVTKELVEYLTPLIQGECTIPYHNGLPFYAEVSHLK